jgi:hypothetical protein
MKKAWLLVAAVLVVSATSNGLEKRQSFNIGTRPGPNNEVILVCEGQDVVFLTGNNAQCIAVAPGHIVDFMNGVVSITDENGVEVQNIPGISEYQVKLCNPILADAVGGPGKLYVSDGRAFYINDGCTFEMNFINQAIANAPPLAVQFGVMTARDMGSLVSNLIVNSGEFQITISGAMAVTLGPADGLSYSGGSISTLQGMIIRGGIMEFAVFNRGANGQAQFNIFDQTESTVVTGPGQAYIGADRAIFIGNLGSGSTPPFQSINSDIVTNTFEFTTNAAGMTVVTSQTNPITVLSSETATFEINGPSTATFSGMQLTFTTTGGQVSNFNGITQFAVIDNNEVTINPPSSSYATGGTVFIDPIEETVFFTTDSNPVAEQTFRMFLPATESVSYSIETDCEGVHNLLRTTGSPPQTDFIQTTTGSYVTNVYSSETVVYSDNQVQIITFLGNPRVCIEQVDRLFTNTASNPAGNFTTSVATPFAGPGTVSYSRGTGFYTTDSNLGNDISFQSRTAPIPDVNFERTPITTNEVDGVNYTVSMVTQTIGGETVITYEATSYTTTSEQKILYADNLVTVHRPIFTGDGSVTYDGATQEVTYPDRDGNRITLTGVTSFNQFSCGNITTTMSPDFTQAPGPGKLYVSDDEATVTFSTSGIITSDITALIRGTPVEFMVNANQFSSIYDGTFNISTETATVTYPGGGVIWSSQFNNNDYALYVDDERESNRIVDAVSSLLLTTKSEPAKDSGILRVIFNGREIYTYSPVGGNSEVRIPPSGFFDYVDMTLSGPSLPDGPYTGYNSITVFDGIEVRQFNSSTTVQRFEGPGLLFLPQDSNRAFYTTNPSTTNYLTQSIAILRNFLSSPQIQPGRGRKTTKNRDITVKFGTDVTVFEGADVTFECNVLGGRPEPTVAFYRVISDTEQELLNSTIGEIIIEDKALTLLNVQMDDVGEYVCVASNGVPPPAMATSTLKSVRPAVAPVLQPGWFPFRPTSVQKLVFPDTSSPAMETIINLREFEQLVLACRMDGRPKVDITWRINDRRLNEVLTRGGYEVLEPVQGRSVLILDLLNTFNETVDNPLLGLNTIECIGANLAGSANGRANLQGEIIECGTMAGGPCPVTCGFGTRDVGFDCTRFNPNPGPIEISRVPLSIIPLIERTEICTTSVNNNVVICPVIEYRWNTTEWSECSKSCNGGVRTRNSSCLEEEFPINSRYAALVNSTTLRPAEDTMCVMSERAGPRPSERELCETQDCPFYQASRFGQCSVTCGGGVRTRTVECVILLNKYKDMNGKTQLNVTDVNITQCGGEPPAESKMCNTFDCFYRWIPGRFGECGNTPSLGPPVSNQFSCKERPVTCVNDMQVPVNDSFCEAAMIPKPPILASCGNKNCFVGIWDTTRFSPCSKTCGYGMQERELLCLSPQTLTRVPTDFCDISRAPIAKRQCFVRNCENMCLRDENPGVCAVVVRQNLCDSQLAMGSSGLRCCVSCGMGTGSD